MCQVPQAHLWPGCGQLPGGPGQAEGARAGGVVAVALLSSRCWVSHHEGQLLESALEETQKAEFMEGPAGEVISSFSQPGVSLGWFGI